MDNKTPSLAPKLNIENCSVEQLIASKTAQSLASNLHLSEAQIAKANQALLRIATDDKLAGATQLSKLRYCYSVAQLNYKSDKATVPVKYGNGIQCQTQYYAYLEDVIDTGKVDPKDTGYVPLFEGIEYKRYIDKFGNDIIEIPDAIIPKSLFERPKIIGYYAYIKTKDGEMFTSLKSVEEEKAWAQRFSISHKAYLNKRASSSIWNSDFEAMAIKTVIKDACRKFLKKYPNDRLQKLIEIDQKVFDSDGESYKDNPQNEKVVELKTKTNVTNSILDYTEGKEEQNDIEVEKETGEVKEETSQN